MGLDIYVSNETTGESLSMNWLRNPYGLCNWSEDNYNYQTESKPDDESEQRLWHVINHWCYDTSEQVDKELFYSVVMRYGQVLLNDLKQGYFFFSEQALDQFITPHLAIVAPALEKHPAVVVREPQGRVYGYPMDIFAHPCFGLSSKYRPHAHTLKHYQEWFAELMHFAEVLRKPGSVFYCSN